MSFWELRVPACLDTAEGMTNFLWEQGALGVVEEEQPGTPARLRAFYPDTTSSTDLLGAVNAYRGALGSLGLDVGGEPEIVPVLDEAWSSAWQQSFPPREIGQRLLIRPPWHAAAAGSRVAVTIEPGRAFGTGHHGSTEGCLALLEAQAAAWSDARNRPGRILDLGTGTGILAIAAIALGAPTARAVDVDPDAMTAAARNAALNGCGERIVLGLGGVECLDGEPAFDVVLANLLAHTHLALAADYRRLVGRGGVLILGGMLADEDLAVSEALEQVGFGLTSRVLSEGWASLLMTRRD